MQTSSGTFLHLDLPLSVELDVYSTIDGDGYTEAEILAKRTELKDARACDLTLFVRGWRTMFSTVELLFCVFAQGHLKLSRDGKVFHTHRSERGHARERKDFMAAAAPGKSWVHHSREELIWQASPRHVESKGLRLQNSMDVVHGNWPESLVSSFDAKFVSCRSVWQTPRHP